MAGYIDSFGPEAKLDDLFTDLYEKANPFFGEPGNSFGHASSVLVKRGLTLGAHSSPRSRFRRRDGHCHLSVGQSDPDAPFGTRKFLYRGERITSLTGRDDFLPEEIGSFDSKGGMLFPDFSLRKTALGLVSLRQLVEAEVPGKDEKLEPGTSEGEENQTIGSLDPKDLARASIVSNEVMKNLFAVQSLIEGSTVEEAFAQANARIATIG